MVAYSEVVPEFTITARAANFRQGPSATVGLEGGGFVTIWARDDADREGYDNDLVGQRYDASGAKIGASFVIVENTSATANLPVQFSAAALPGGGFAVVNKDYRRSPDDDFSSDIVLQIFDSSGNRVGNEHFVNVEGVGASSEPEIEVLDNGNLVVVWDDSNEYDIKARIFDAAGNAESQEIVVETGIRAIPGGSVVFGTEEPSVTALADGGFVVAWSDYRDSNIYQRDVRARRFEASGQAVGSDFLLSTSPADDQETPRLTAVGNGFVALWTDKAGGTDRVRAQLFNAESNKIGTEFTIGGALKPGIYGTSITTLANGDWVVIVEDSISNSMQLMIFDGLTGNLTGPLTISDGAANLNRGFPSVAALAGGGFVVTWDDEAANGRIVYGIRAQIFAPAIPRNLLGSDADDRLIGGAVDDTLYGGAGNDILTGLVGADLLDGGPGADSLVGGAGDDQYIVDRQDDLIFENADQGNDTATATVGYYLWANVENLILAAGAGDIFAVGNELANTLTGNEGSNLLIGGAGSDVLVGGFGVDSLFGEAGADTLNGGPGIDYLVGGSGNDVLNGDANADALYGEDGDDTLNGGSDFQTDILVGGAGNDSLNGASGLGDYDLMDGAGGNDIYFVDTPDDLTFEAAGGGTDTVRANINGAGYYLYAHTENLILEGNTPFGVGNELANQLTGNAIGNYLLGGLGADTLNGKAGNDVLFGEGGADTFVFERGTGGDVIGDFAPGTDKISLSGLGFANYAALQPNIFQVGGNSGINLGQGDFIVLNGVTNAQLSAADFLFG